MGEFIYRMGFFQYILKLRRMRRAKNILGNFDISKNISIIDIGCGINGRSFSDYVPSNFNIVGVDIIDNSQIMHNHLNFKYYKMDAAYLSIFTDKQFDMAVSIGMMEHICDNNKLLNIAKEIRRVAKKYVVIVPYRYAWIEPHFKFPFFSILPSYLQLLTTRLFNLHNLGNAVRRNSNYIVENYQWLTAKEWLKIFPGAHIKLMGTLETIAIIG
jgi:ubiquinone/menaquinone biosynthesis C-methylase UbiE